MKIKKVVSYAFFSALLTSQTIFSQDDLNSKLSKVPQSYSNVYLQPLVDAIGLSLNSGFFDGDMRALDPAIPFEPNFAFDLKVSAIFLNSSDQSFNLTFTDTINTSQGRVLATYNVNNAPTFFGNKNAPVATGTYTLNGNTFAAPNRELIGGVFDTKVFPFIMPQLQLGTVYGTDVIIRFIPKIKVEDASFGMFGIGVRHRIDPYLPADIPFAVSGKIGYQNLYIKNSNNTDLLSGNGFLFGVDVGKQVASIINLYAGLQYQSFSTDINYDYETQDVSGNTVKRSVTYTEDGAGLFRFKAGADFDFGPVNFNLNGGLSSRAFLNAALGVGF